MRKEHIKLTETECKTLETLLSKGEVTAKVFKRATALLELNRGKTLQAVAETTGVSYQTVSAWRDRYQSSRLASLHDAPRAGRPVAIDGEQRAQITALACSEAPVGYSQWSLRLLAEKIVELGCCATISHTQVGHILKKTH